MTTEEHVRKFARFISKNVVHETSMEINFTIGTMENYPHETITWLGVKEVFYSKLFASLRIHYCKMELIKRRLRGNDKCKTKEKM